MRQQQLAEEERERQEAAEKALRERREAEWVGVLKTLIKIFLNYLNLERTTGKGET